MWFVAIPMIFMLVLPGAAMGVEVFGEGGYLARSLETGDWNNWTLTFFGLATLALEVWMIVEAIIAWPKARGVLEAPLEALSDEGYVAGGGRSC